MAKAPAKKPVAKRYTQKQVEAGLKKDAAARKNPIPSAAAQAKMKQKIAEENMDKNMKAAAKKPANKRGYKCGGKVKK